MKLAHVILCHKGEDQLKRLLVRLLHEDADFYIHLDKKTDINSFLFLAGLKNVFFIKNRIKVYWGGYSVVQATVNSFLEIISTGKQYDYINILSGQDYPIASTEAIHSFYANNPGKAFMIMTLPLMDECVEFSRKISKYYFFDFHFRGKHFFEKVANTVMPDRAFPKTFVPVGNSQWMTISFPCAVYITNILKVNSTIKKLFRYTWAPDEMVFQSILYNSPFKNVIVGDNQRYTNWSKGEASPKILTMKDAKDLTNSDKLFARKFDPQTDEKIIDYLDDLNAASQQVPNHLTKKIVNNSHEY